MTRPVAAFTGPLPLRTVTHFTANSVTLPHRPHRTAPRPLTRATVEPPEDPSPVSTRPNLSKYKSQRAILSGDKLDVNATDVNDLMVRASKPARDLGKWKLALKGSFSVVSARLVSGGTLVGFARSTSDHALNATIWDVVTDPSLPDEMLMKRNLIRYMLKELRRAVPGCSIALFSGEADRQLFESLDFVADPDGIRGMALFDDSTPHYLS